MAALLGQCQPPPLRDDGSVPIRVGDDVISEDVPALGVVTPFRDRSRSFRRSASREAGRR